MRSKKSQRTLFWLVIAGLTMLAGLFLRLYYLSSLRRRQERVIEADNEKSLRLEKQLIEEELDRAKGGLAEFMDNLSQKQSLIDTVSAQLAERSPTEPATPAAQSNPETRQNLINSSLLSERQGTPNVVD